MSEPVILRTIDVAIHPTPAELAKAWCEMGSNEQAEFFEHVARFTAEWVKPLCVQLQSVTDSTVLTKAGRRVMHVIGEYSLPSQLEP